MGSTTKTLHTALHNDLMGSEGGEENKEMSQSLPFVPRPKLLDGSLAGDVGFDPFGLAGEDKESLLNMREAEIKHGRLAMLAVVGWPIAELFDRQIAEAAGKPSLLTKAGESPSILNGGLEKIDVLFWIALVSLSGIIEIENMKMKDEKGKNYQPGDCNFDPLKLLPEDRIGIMEMQTKEIKHGRVAMMAILGFVVQEALFGIPVVQETPFFFKPLFS